ncbi:MAG: AAA family ATPase, partial [Sulfurovum sp.]|nr:AAA family ATPase [Sulfurovum sp.]
KLLIFLYINEQGLDVEFLYTLESKTELMDEMKDSEINFPSEKDFNKYINKTDEQIEISTLNKKAKLLYLDYKELFKFDFIDEKSRNYNNLSHGERTLFGQFLKIYIIIEKYKEAHIFLLDEPDLTLHPDWQKKYINELFNLLKQIEVNSHFLLTTHSPFIISDLPKENVIFLDTYKKDEESNQKEGNCKVLKDGIKKQTFGANIHTLLSDGFFMDDGLMGEFAKNKINDVYDFISNPNSKMNLTQIKAKEVIKIIGEPILKKELQYLYDEKFETSEIDKKIREYQAEIERLQAQRRKND